MSLQPKRGDFDTLCCLLRLASDGVIFFVRTGGTGNPAAFINCSDTFAYATADVEPLPFDRALEFERVYRQFGSDGIVAWCAVKRGMSPLTELVTPRYLEAIEAIPRKEDAA